MPAFKPRTFRPAGQAKDARPNRHERGYTDDWAKASKSHLSQHPLCCWCMAKGITTPATVTDHIIPVVDGQQDAGFWLAANWASMCAPCHWDKTRTEKNPGRHVVVCGRPGAGKSTYVDTNKKSGDIVFDWDIIRDAMTTAVATNHAIDLMLTMRESWLRWCAAHVAASYWFVTDGSRTEAQAVADRLGAELVVIDTPAEECLRRVAARGRHAPSVFAAIANWG